jgi:uncharacterized iron-regulated protein
MHTRAVTGSGGRLTAVLALAGSLVLNAALAAVTGCGGGSGAGGAREPSEKRGVEAAGLPFRILRARGGQEIGWTAFLAELGRADAICVGENHRNPHDHWAQLHLVDALTDANRRTGTATALGMEMFQRPFQGVLDDFTARRIDEAALLSRTAWKTRWGFDWSLYRPIILLARERGAALVALNIPRELTRKVARKGIDRLEPSDRTQLPQLVLDDAQHRAWWDAIMEEMGGSGHGHAGVSEDGDDDGGEDDGAEDGDDKKKEKPSPSPDDTEEADQKAAGERMYTAQVLWDETMADGASRWLAGSGTPAGRRQIVILAGNGHCHESAVIRRIERRGVKAAVSVRPIIDGGEGEVAGLLAAPENDYLFVMTMPSR